MSEEKLKTCKECKAPFDQVRLDQFFCCRKCRNTFHNRNLRIDSRNTKSVDTALHRNRKILASLKENTIEKDELLKQGFNFTYITEVFTRKNKTYFGCYNFCYTYSNENTIQIFSRQ